MTPELADLIKATTNALEEKISKRDSTIRRLHELLESAEMALRLFGQTQLADTLREEARKA